jgi:hypothetical protein
MRYTGVRAGIHAREMSALGRLVEIFVSGGQRMCLRFHREFANWAAQYWAGQTNRRRLGLRGCALLALQLVVEQMLAMSRQPIAQCLQ